MGGASASLLPQSASQSPQESQARGRSIWVIQYGHRQLQEKEKEREREREKDAKEPTGLATLVFTHARASTREKRLLRMCCSPTLCEMHGLPSPHPLRLLLLPIGQRESMPRLADGSRLCLVCLCGKKEENCYSVSSSSSLDANFSPPDRSSRCCLYSCTQRGPLTLAAPGRSDAAAINDSASLSGSWI